MNSVTDIKTEEEIFYGKSYNMLVNATNEIVALISRLRERIAANDMRDPVEHVKTRIKSVDSMKKKLVKNGFDPTAHNALNSVFDAAGIRIVCTFLDDVYLIVNLIKQQKKITAVCEKDYIKNPKPNGYRSYHMIVKIDGVYAEIQIRTIAMDCWASLEHQLKYKRKVNNQAMIISELKRCADEIASTDITLQTIRDLIDTSDQQPAV